MSTLILNWLDEKVPGFRNLSDNEKSEIQNFTLLWSLFEGTKLNAKANVNRIRDFANNLEQIGIIEHIDFDEYRDYLTNRYFDSERNDFSYHHSHLHLEKSGSPAEVDRMLKGQKISKAEQLIGCLAIVYRLRNNLFHGEKWAYELQDQYSNFFQANKLLMILMDLPN